MTCKHVPLKSGGAIFKVTLKHPLVAAVCAKCFTLYVPEEFHDVLGQALAGDTEWANDTTWPSYVPPIPILPYPVKFGTCDDDE